MADHPHVLVVGAGIVGAAIAWHLCRGGARVTILEAGAPGGIATAGSLAWINASWGHRDDYFRLRFQAMADWRRLEAMVPALRVAWTGGLLWDMPADRMAAFAADHTARAYAVRTVDRAEAARIEPALAAPPEAAVHAAGEGAVEPLDAALALISAARAHGATLIADRPARAIERRAGRVVGVATDAGPLSADMVVIAAGAGTAALAGTAGIALPVDDPPALLLATRPHPPILRGFVLAPELHIRQARDGRLMAGAGFDGGNVADAGARTFACLRGCCTAARPCRSTGAGSAAGRSRATGCRSWAGRPVWTGSTWPSSIPASRWHPQSAAWPAKKS